MEYAIRKVKIMEEYRNKYFTAIFIVKEFKREFLLYCKHVASKRNDHLVNDNMHYIVIFHIM